jgi:DNA-binding response OmpR family regulator
VLRQATRILLVEDEMTFLPTAAQLLRREGYICDWASDVREDTAALAAQPYNLRVADLDPAKRARCSSDCPDGFLSVL